MHFFFFWFHKPKEHHKRTKLGSNETIKDKVKKRWFAAQSEQFYSEGIAQLVRRWRKSTDLYRTKLC